MYQIFSCLSWWSFDRSSSNHTPLVRIFMLFYKRLPHLSVVLANESEMKEHSAYLVSCRDWSCDRCFSSFICFCFGDFSGCVCGWMIVHYFCCWDLGECVSVVVSVAFLILSFQKSEMFSRLLSSRFRESKIPFQPPTITELQNFPSTISRCLPNSGLLVLRTLEIASLLERKICVCTITIIPMLDLFLLTFYPCVYLHSFSWMISLELLETEREVRIKGTHRRQRITISPP